MKAAAKNLGVTILAILGTGLLLDFAGRGKLGMTMQSLARQVTRGYGV